MSKKQNIYNFFVILLSFNIISCGDVDDTQTLGTYTAILVAENQNNLVNTEPTDVLLTENQKNTDNIDNLVNTKSTDILVAENQNNVAITNNSPIISVCNRTPAIQKAILEELKKSHCTEITKTDLTKIIILSLTQKNITSLKKEDFLGFNSLVYLSLRFNNLQTIPKGIFSKKTLPNLERLSLGYNLFTNTYKNQLRLRIKTERKWDRFTIAALFN